MKRLCKGCNTEKELNSDNFVKDKNDPSGFTYRCKTCRYKKSKEWNKANPDKVKVANDKNKKKRKEFYNSPAGKISSRRAHLKRKYNLSLEEYNEMMNKQNHKCALCGGSETHDKHGVLAVDHDHKTGKIRSLLCYKCNSGLGHFNDSKKLLSKAIKYLEEHEPNDIL